ncbi:MAG: DUF4160 domain-containing protein [Deltaproteobacteria bacterium]|nr:DUF4160 domain-containing protein [Deltaproteobacteria bacterium]
MDWLDHAPPHFQALYGEHEAWIDPRDLQILQGSLPRRSLNLVNAVRGLFTIPGFQADPAD